MNDYYERKRIDSVEQTKLLMWLIKWLVITVVVLGACQCAYNWVERNRPGTTTDTVLKGK